MPSKSSEISIAEWRSVPLNSRCSRKCESAGLAGLLVARSGPHPEAEGDRAHRGHRLGDHPEAVELGELDVLREVRQPARASSVLDASGARRRRRHGRRRHGRGLGRRPPPRPPSTPPRPRAATAAAAVAAADRRQLLGGLARDRRVVGEAQADPAALAVDLDHGHVELVAGG